MSKPLENKEGSIINSLDEDIFVALFKRGAHEYLQKTTAETEEPDTMSELCEQKILRSIKKDVGQKKLKRTVRKLSRVAAIVLIVLAILTATIMSVEAFRIPFFNLFINSGDKITGFTLHDGSEANTLSQFEGPSYLPIGYELNSTEVLGKKETLTYLNSAGECLLVSRFQAGSDFTVDTEDAETSNIDVNGYQGLYSIKDGRTRLAFRTDNYAYLLDVPADLSEAIKIASSIIE